MKKNLFIFIALIMALVGLQAQTTITNLPYVENFDGVTGNTSTSGLANHVLPTGWEWYNNVASTASYAHYPSCYSSSTYVHSTPNALRFHTYNTTANNASYADQYAILPPVNVSGHNLNSLQLSFQMRGYNSTATYYAKLVVGVMTSPTDISTFVPIDSVESAGSTTYASYVINLSSYTGSGQYIALKAPRPDASKSHYNAFLVDDLVLEEIPSCPQPSHLALATGGATTNSLTVTWTENGTASNWEVEYSLTGSTDGAVTKVMAISKPFTITGLQWGTLYDIRVRSICDIGDTSAFCNPITVSTQCDIIRTLPYTQDFEGLDGLTTTTATSSNLPQYCWSQTVVGSSSLSSTSSYRGYPIVYKNATYAHSGVNALRFYTYTTASTYGDEYGILPAIDITQHPINTLQMEFFASRTSTYAFNFEVGVMTDSSNASTFVPIQSFAIPTTEPTQTYELYMLDFSSYTGNGRFIAFRMLKPATGYLSGYIDDIRVFAIPNCHRPMNVEVTQVYDQTAKVVWTPTGDETQWDVTVVDHGISANAGTIITAMDSFLLLTGLTPDTTYDVYVRANCGNEVSDWSYATTFTTRCTPINAIPFTENFDNYPATTAAASGVLPDCWLGSTNNPTPYPYISSSYHSSGTGSAYLYATSAYYSLLTTPLLDLSSYQAGDLLLRFNALRTSSTAGYGRIQVGVMTDADDISTFTLLKEVSTMDYPTLGAWEDFSVVLSDYYATPVYLAFYLSNTGTASTFIDDVVLDYAPDCLSPTKVFAKNITGTSARVAWKKAASGVSGYTVEYTVAGQNNWTTAGTTDAAYYDIYGLQPETEYNVRVLSVCSAGASDSVGCTFRTMCLIQEPVQAGSGTNLSAYAPMYSAYQYGYAQQLYTASEDLNNTAMDINALAFQYAGTGTTTRTIDIYMLHTTETSVAAWIPMTNAHLVFSGDVDLHPDMSAGGWITIPLDSSFQYDGMSNLLVAIYTHNSTSLSNVTGDKNFRCTNVSGMTRYLYNTGSAGYDPLDVTSLSAGTASANRPNIRFIHCNSNSTCAAPLMTIADVMNDNVTVEWHPGYQENTWELQYKPLADMAWISVGTLTSGSTYTITNLQSNTDYQVRMRSICTDTSAWVTESFHTVCYPFATVPFTEDFENATGSGAGNFVPCWTTLTNYTSAYPYTSNSTTYTHSGTYGTYFYATSAYYTLAASPRFDNSVRMDSLQIRFWAKKSSAAYFMEVGIMTNPNDYSTFELIERVSPDTISTWREISITTAGYTGNGRFIAFRLPIETTNYMYIDDISVSYITPCARVADVYVGAISNNTATMHWVPGGDETLWYYTYGIADSVDLATAVWTSTTDTMVTLSGLVARTEYDFYVISECTSGLRSDAMKTSFTTTCDPIVTLPFLENFDGLSGTSQISDCWHRLYLSSAITVPLTTSYPYSSSSYSASGPYSLYFFNNITASQTYSIGVLPEMDATIPIQTLRATFDLLKMGVSYTMQVGVMTNPTDPSTFVNVATVGCDTIKRFETKNVDFTSYTGSGRYIAFKSSGDGLYLDNLMVDVAPMCSAPTHLTFSAITGHDAVVSWQPSGNETSWEIFLLTYGDMVTDVTPIVVQNDTSYQLTNLDFGTTYTVKVRAVCPGGTGYSAYVDGSLTTACESISTLPYTQDFDRMQGLNNTTSSDNNLPLCWNYLNETTTASYSGYPIVYQSASYAHSGVNSVRFYVYTPATYSDQYAVLPQINTSVLPINTLQLSLNMRKYSTSYSHFMAIVGVMSDPTQDSTFVPVDTITTTSMDYERKIAYLDGYTGTGSYLAIRVPKIPTLNYNAGYIDDIVIEPLSNCRPVENLHATQIGPDEIFVAWTPRSTESAWLVQYKSVLDTAWTDVTATAPTLQITNLLPSTPYTIRVAADCGGTYSDFSQPYSITTDCNVMTTLPYITNFDDVTGSTSASTNNLPPCWHYLNIGYSSDTYSGYPIVYNDNSSANSGDNSVRFYAYTSGNTTYGDQWAILPSVDIGLYSLSNLQLKFNASKYSDSYPFRLIVGVMSNVLDPATFVPVDTVMPSSTAYEPFTVYFDHYTGSGKNIAMMVEKPMSSYNAGQIDDLELSLAPSCRPVTDVRVVSTTPSSVTLTWDVNGTENAWIISYLAVGDTSWMSQSVSGSPTATVQNLTPNTAYYFRVQADCGNGDLAEVSIAALIRTDCEFITQMPYSENFDGVQGSTTGAVNNLPPCWNHLSGTYASFAGYPIVYSTSSVSHSTPNSVRFYTNTTSTDYGDQYAILPPIDPSVYPINTLRMSFYARENSTSSNYDLTLLVGVMTDPYSSTSFIAVDTVVCNSTTYSSFTVNFSSYTGNGAYIALMAPRNSGVGYNIGYVDDILVEVAPVDCHTPTNLTVSNIATTAAIVSWTPGGNETNWNLQYKQVADTVWSVNLPVSGTPSHLLTNLTANTQYVVRVQAACNAVVSSDWSDIDTFTTAALVPPTVVTLAASDITATSAKLNGTVAQGSETIMSQGFLWKETAGGTYTTVNAGGATIYYDLTGLTPNTNYTFRAFALTESGTTYGDEMTFTTNQEQQETCPAPTNVNQAILLKTPNAIISWTQEEGDANEWKFFYKKVSESMWDSVITTTPYVQLTVEDSVLYEGYVVTHCTNGLWSNPSDTITFQGDHSGIDEYELNNVVVYPNPTTGLVQIKNGEWRMENVEVYDAYGKLLNEMNVNDHTANLDLSGYAKGTYFVRVTTEKGVVTKRVVKN